MKIFIPKNEQIKERILNEVEKSRGNDYLYKKVDYQFYRELSTEKFDAVDIHSKEHMTGNVLIYDDGETFILDGMGYCRVKFKF